MHHHSWLRSSDSFTWQPNAAEISPGLREEMREMPLCIRVDQARTFLFSSLAESSSGCTNVQKAQHSPRYVSILSSLTHRASTHGRPRRVQQQQPCLRPLPSLSRRCGDGLHRRESSVSPSHRLRASDDRGAALKAARFHF